MKYLNRITMAIFLIISCTVNAYAGNAIHKYCDDGETYFVNKPFDQVYLHIYNGTIDTYPVPQGAYAPWLARGAHYQDMFASALIVQNPVESGGVDFYKVQLEQHNRTKTKVYVCLHKDNPNRDAVLQQIRHWAEE